MEEGSFLFHISDEVIIDLAKISQRDWNRIKNDVKFFLKSKQCNDIGKAYICAFLVYIQDLEALSEPYNPDKHKFV